ncbi:probable E3 ubiquitin-protein ligase HERC6 isoform X2 [Bufo gargarizans]|uniref:probable E3 ubiquitin-protein ligase HERC6 isoform X2 n=1 Tax=Bufo gargarizans TaxID=30331 RepID=UPI001CF22E4D|nr:probable E3 ubiquitin-protein ligase HERC6 isoform X2 [Bufo gargarizans]
MYCWGNNRSRQLGLVDKEEEDVDFTENDYFTNQVGVQKVACGGRHTLFLQEDGIVLSCGQNDYEQLGRRTDTSSLGQIHSLEAQTIVDVSCGSNHSVAICSDGNIFTWGGGSQGQLGLGQFPQNSRIPRKISVLSDIRIIQISCGHFHTVALSEDCNVFSWGKNDFGQLGLGKPMPNQAIPQVVKSLKGVPLLQVSAGGSQSFALSMSGIVFGWGKNNAGQIGLESDPLKGVFKPNAISSLRDKGVIYISCGDEHTAVLSKEGTVYTFGDGTQGQLGKSSITHTSVPQKIEEYERQVSQIACGSYHTLLYVLTSNQIVSFGHGIQVKLDDHLPEVPLEPDIVFTSKDLKDISLKQIFAGNNVSFATSTLQPQTHTITLLTDNLRKICRLDKTVIEKWIDTKPGTSKHQDAKREIIKIFSAPACLTASFLKNRGSSSDPSAPIVDLQVANELFTTLCQHKWIADIICSSLKNELIPATESLPNLFEALSVFLLIPECPIMQDANICLPLASSLVQAINNLSLNSQKILETLWSSLPEPSLIKQVQVFKIALVLSVFNDNKESKKNILEVLKRLYKANMKAGYKVPINYFCVPEVSNVIIIPVDLKNWRIYQRQTQETNGTMLPEIYCRYPFILTFATKIQYLHYDVIEKMTKEKIQANQVLMMNRLQGSSENPRIPILHLKLRHQHLVEDALKKLSVVEDCDLQKELQVEFHGEPTTDPLANMAEFFLLVAEKMVQPDYGLFTCTDPLLPVWFPSHPLADKKLYYLYGIMCGLAIFNQTVIYLPFPLALFKKLLGKKITLEDLKELQPTMGRSMQSLLDTEHEKDVERLDLYFTLSWEKQTIELIPNGATERVTHLNKHKYVTKCVEYIFNTSVADTFEEFRKGLYKVCDKDILLFFQPEELMSLVAGHVNYDWTVFEKTTIYSGKYSPTHPTIVMFWNVFHQLPLEKKKAFLYFITGNDKIPAFRLQHLFMKISSFGVPSESYLPEANTCSQLLLLPEYSSSGVLRRKLLLALENNRGFEKNLKACCLQPVLSQVVASPLLQ